MSTVAKYFVQTAVINDSENRQFASVHDKERSNVTIGTCQLYHTTNRQERNMVQRTLYISITIPRDVAQSYVDCVLNEKGDHYKHTMIALIKEATEQKP